MAWTESGIYRDTLLDHLNATVSVGLQTPTYKFALYNNSVTPAAEDADTASAFGGTVWTTANEIANTDGTGNWPAGGYTLVSPTINAGSGGATGSGVVIYFLANDITTTSVTTEDSAGSGAPAAAYGGLVYASSGNTGGTTNAGYAFVDFGGAYQSTNGTFNVSWGVLDTSTGADAIWALIAL